MNFSGKTVSGIIAAGAFLFAGILLVTCMAEALQCIWEPTNRKGANEDE